MLHAERISSFLVCNAQHPDQLAALKAVTQLYVSIDASNKESLRKIDRPLHRDFWERFQRHAAPLNLSNATLCDDLLCRVSEEIRTAVAASRRAFASLHELADFCAEVEFVAKERRALSDGDAGYATPFIDDNPTGKVNGIYTIEIESFNASEVTVVEYMTGGKINRPEEYHDGGMPK